MMNRHLLWLFPLLCVILISTLSLHAQSQPPASDEFASGEASCQDGEAAENQRYQGSTTEATDRAKRCHGQAFRGRTRLGKAERAEAPFYECFSDAAEEQKKASIEINKKGIEEAKTNQNKLLEINKTCLAQAPPSHKPTVTGKVNNNRFPNEKGHTDPGDSIPFPPNPHLGSQEIIITVDGDHGDKEPMEGKIKQGSNPDQVVLPVRQRNRS
jgi:hypothetical protein